MKCPRCLILLDTSSYNDLQESLDHIQHCIWCENMDDKLMKAKRDYLYKNGNCDWHRMYLLHPNNPSLWKVKRILLKMKGNLK